MKYCGIDLHSNNCVVIVSDEHDRVVYQNRLPNDLGPYIPQVEDTIWREFRCQSGGRNAPLARRVVGATDAANP